MRRKGAGYATQQQQQQQQLAEDAKGGDKGRVGGYITAVDECRRNGMNGRSCGKVPVQLLFLSGTCATIAEPRILVLY